MRLALVIRPGPKSNVCPRGAGGLSPAFQPWAEPWVLCTICRRVPMPRPRPSSITPGNIAPQCKQNTGWKPMLLYAVASSLGVHGDGSERSLNSPETQCSIGFQPVFCRTVERCFFQVSAVPQSCVQSPAEPSPRFGIKAVCYEGGGTNGESR
jgi:hypothetical protein